MRNQQVSGVRFLYTQNPFYLISTAFVLYGLHVACSFSGGTAPWQLAAGLIAFSSLIAATAFLIVRFGQVWDDARSLLLILLFMFLAISVSFDEFCVTNPLQAAGLLVGGFCFSVFISELLLQGLKLPLSLWVRGPYYLMLGLFFSFPLFVSQEGCTSTDVLGRIMMMPSLGAIIMLMLLPAIRQGKRLAEGMPSTWQWPLYPWSMFVFLLLGLGFRPYLLSVAFVENAGLPFITHWYFMAPLILTIFVLVLEGCFVANNRTAQGVTLLLAPLTFSVCFPIGSNYLTGAYGETYSLFFVAGWSPFEIGIWALVAFYAYAWCRKVTVAPWALAAVALFAASLNVTDAGRIELTTPHPAVWIGYAAVLMFQGIRRRQSVLCFVGSCFALIAVTLLIEWGSIANHQTAVVAHLAWLSAIVCGVVFKDAGAAWLRGLAALSLLFFCPTVLMFAWFGDLPPLAALIYVTAMSLTASMAWVHFREEWILVGAVIATLAHHAAQVTCVLTIGCDTFGSEAFIPLLLGVSFFLIAAVISSIKAGAFTKQTNFSD